MADPNAELHKRRAAIDPIVPIAVLAGAALGALTYATSNSDIGGENWSLRGNGSIAVLFAGGGALLGFGWLALGFGASDERGYLNKALLGAAAVLVLEVVFIFAPIAIGPSAGATAVLPLVVVTLAAAAITGVALAKGGAIPAIAVLVAALAASVAPLGLEFFLVPLFLPVTVAVPCLSRAPNGWLLLNSIALLLALLVGLYGAQTVLNR